MRMILQGALVVALVALTVTAQAADTACPQHVADDAPSRLVGERLGTGTRERCDSGYGLLHSGVTRTGLRAAGHLTRDKAGLKAARELKAVETDKALPDRIEPPKPVYEVESPFG